MIEKGYQLHHRAMSYGCAIPAVNSLLADCGEYAKGDADMLAAFSAIRLDPK